MSLFRTRLQNLLPPGTLTALGRGVTQQILQDVADGAYAYWLQRASTALKATRGMYMSGIQPLKVKPGMAVLSLVGAMPNALENGQPAMDMHDTLLGDNVPVVPREQKGKHAKKGGGFYRAIPFRHGTPDSQGQAGTPMGQAYQGMVSNSQKLGKDIYAAAQKLSASTGLTGGKMAWGGRLPEGRAPKLKPAHATDIYAGMVKQQKTYKSATQNQYTTFRTISTGSPGWRRKATAGKQFLKDVQTYVGRVAPMAIEAYLKGIGG